MAPGQPSGREAFRQSYVLNGHALPLQQEEARWRARTASDGPRGDAIVSRLGSLLQNEAANGSDESRRAPDRTFQIVNTRVVASCVIAACTTGEATGAAN